MRSAFLTAVFSALFLSLVAPVRAQDTGSGFTGNVNLFLGKKTLDDQDWPSPWDEQAEGALLIDFGGRAWPINIAIGFRGSESDANPIGIKAKTSEFQVGLRKYWAPTPHMHPFLGGGVTAIGAEWTIGATSYSDSGAGLWLDAGILWALGGMFNIGFEAAASGADVNGLNAGGGHFGLVLGYHF